MRMSFLLVVIPVIDENCILALKSERQAPIAVHFYGPMMFQVAMQRVQLPTWSIHVFCRLRPIQLKELNRQFCGMRRLDSSFASGREELLDASVPEALNHAYSVARQYSVVKEGVCAEFPIKFESVALRDGCWENGMERLGSMVSPLFQKARKGWVAQLNAAAFTKNPRA
jgi:hypothetical protein